MFYWILIYNIYLWLCQKRRNIEKVNHFWINVDKAEVLNNDKVSEMNSISLETLWNEIWDCVLYNRCK